MKRADLQAASDAAYAALDALLVTDDIAAMEAAEAALDALNRELFAYDEKVYALKAIFEKLNAENPVVDPCVAAENAAGCFQDGFTDEDIEYWTMMVAEARRMIEGA